MGQFEYVMVLISIVIGLGITHMLSGLAEAIPALAKRAKPVTLHPAFLWWFGYVFLYLVSFWWFEFEWSEYAGPWTFGLYLLLIGYAMVLYVLAVVLVPARRDDLDDTWGHFLSVRRWFFVVLLGATGLDVIDSLWKGVGWGSDAAYWTFNAGVVAACAIGWRSTTPRTHSLVAGVMFVWQLGFMFAELGLLGLVGHAS